MIPSPQSHLEIAALSHPGELRENNEDNYAILSYHREKDHSPIVLAIVSDGIGGHQAGEVASKVTVDTIIETLEGTDGEEPLTHLRLAIQKAGENVLRLASEHLEQRGMGATASVAWIIGDRLYTAHVGDSRIYLLRKGTLRQVTVDHSWVQQALDLHLISPEEALDHPYSHILHRAVGSPVPPEPDFRLKLTGNESDPIAVKNQGLRLAAGDQILLCSDGLTDLVEDGEITAALAEQAPEEAVQSLVSLARARGGPDNITALVLAVPDQPPQKASRRRKLIRVALATLLLAVALSAAIFLAYRSLQKTTGVELTATTTPLAEETTSLPSLTPTFSPTPPSTPQPTKSSPTPFPSATFTPVPLATAAPSDS